MRIDTSSGTPKLLKAKSSPKTHRKATVTPTHHRAKHDFTPPISTFFSVQSAEQPLPHDGKRKKGKRNASVANTPSPTTTSTAATMHLLSVSPRSPLRMMPPQPIPINAAGVPQPATKAQLQFLVNCYLDCPESYHILFGGVVMDEWDVSRIHDMSELFAHREIFDEYIASWDVSNVVTMQEMFVRCSAFNQSVQEWNVRKCQNMRHMFAGCTSFNQPLWKWSVHNVLHFDGMFRDCAQFDQSILLWMFHPRASALSMFEHYVEGGHARTAILRNIAFLACRERDTVISLLEEHLDGTPTFPHFSTHPRGTLKEHWTEMRCELELAISCSDLVDILSLVHSLPEDAQGRPSLHLDFSNLARPWYRSDKQFPCALQQMHAFLCELRTFQFIMDGDDNISLLRSKMLREPSSVSDTTNTDHDSSSSKMPSLSQQEQQTRTTSPTSVADAPSSSSSPPTLPVPTPKLLLLDVPNEVKNGAGGTSEQHFADFDIFDLNDFDNFIANLHHFDFSPGTTV